MSSLNPQCVPFLQVKDARSSCAFYCNVLGFESEWEYQPELTLPAVICVRRDGIRLFLTEHPESSIGALVYCYVNDVDQLHREIVAHGVALEWEPTDTPWRMRELQLRDPDGNKLRFGSPCSQEG